MNISDEQQKTIVDHLVRSLSPFLIILFGSASKNQLRNDSDVDIAFLSTTSHDPFTVFAEAQRLATKLGRDVDLVDLSQTSTVFRAQIIARRCHLALYR